MIKFYFAIVVSIFLSISSFGQAIDSLACREFESKLQIIRNFLDTKKSDPLVSRAETVKILVLLTGIKSESSVNYGGQLSPTENDYRKWHGWYIRNKQNLFWDDKLNVIRVRRDYNRVDREKGEVSKKLVQKGI